MALPAVSALQLSFAAGLDQSTREELLDPGSAWSDLQNVRQHKRGGATKRYGFASQAVSYVDTAMPPELSDRSSAHRLFVNGKQTCVVTGTHLDTYSPAASKNIRRSRVPVFGLSMSQVSTLSLGDLSIIDAAYADTVICGNYLVVTYSNFTVAAAVYVVVLDAATGGVVLGPTNIATAFYGLLATHGTYVYLFASLGTGTISYFRLNTASLNSGWTSGTAASDQLATGVYDIILAVESLSDRVALAYLNDSAGTSQVTVKTFNASGVVQTQTLNTASVTPDALAMQGSISDTLWVSWNESTAVELIGLDADSLAVTLATKATVLTLNATTNTAHFDIGVTSSATAGAVRVVANDGDNLYMHMCTAATVAGAVTPGGQVTVPNATLSGRPFTYEGRYYAICYGGEAANEQKRVILCDLSEASKYVRPVANIAPALATSYGNSRPATAGDGVYYIPVTVATTGTSAGLYLAKLDATDVHRWQPVSHARVTFLSGAILSQFDGDRVTETNFVLSPPAPSGADGGGSALTGDFRYVAVYDHVDANGTIHISGVSEPSAVVTVASKQITVTVKPLSISGRLTATTDTAVRISIYRTGGTSGVPPYYYLTSLPNTLTSATQTYTDTTSTTDLASRAKLYAASLPGINGSAQDRRAPSGLTHLVAYNGMLVGSQGEDLFYSGQDVSGEGSWFNPIFQVPISGDGPITGLAAQDGTLYVFKRRAVYAVAGEAPSDNGAAGGLGMPRRLAVDVGCLDARSIVVTGAGIFFRSERGIEILTRAQAVEWIGERVQDTLAEYPYVISATVDARESLVYFELSTDNAPLQGQSEALVFDLSLGTWISHDTRTAYGGSEGARSQGGAMVWDGTEYRYAWLNADGRVNVEHDDYYDTGSGNTWVASVAETPKMRMAGIQANHKLISAVLLAERHTNHQTRINVAYDDSSTWTDSETWTAVETAALTREQLQVDCSNEQIMSVKIRIEDLVPSNTTATPITTGKGATWVGLALNIGPNNTRQATTLLPAEHRK